MYSSALPEADLLVLMIPDLRDRMVRGSQSSLAMQKVLRPELDSEREKEKEQ